jgi:hypothetical protein
MFLQGLPSCPTLIHTISMDSSDSESMYRMPIGFGPSWGPRQGPNGRRFTGEPIRTTLVTWAFRTDRIALAEILPPRFTPDRDPIVTVRLQYNLGFPWLAGRGYDYIEVLCRAQFKGEHDESDGDFVAVMWENMAEPIIVGREEAGHPKLYADIPPLVTGEGFLHAAASRYGFEFFSLDLWADGMKLGDWPFDREESVPLAEPGQGLSPRPRLNCKYLPNSVRPGYADVAEVIRIPAGVYQQRVLDRWDGNATARFNAATWEQLPMYGQVVNALSELPLLAPAGASVMRIVKYTNDLRDDMSVLR